MWISRTEWTALKKRVAALEAQFQKLQSQKEAMPQELRKILLAQREEHFIGMSPGDMKVYLDEKDKEYRSKFSPADDVDLQKSHTCIAYHIQAFQRQMASEEPANMCEACEHCPYLKEGCELYWYRYISQAIPKTRYWFTLLKDGAYLPENNADSPSDVDR